ncbi:MAG: efflux RND transporter periplasmic adaptor subunit [Myxococcota bacterium]
MWRWLRKCSLSVLLLSVLAVTTPACKRKDAINRVSTTKEGVQDDRGIGAKTKKRVETFVATRGPLHKRVRLLGTLHGAREARLSVRQDGVVGRVSVAVGQRVRAGDVLLALADAPRKELWELAQRQEQLARAHVRRMTALAERGAVSLRELELTRKDLLQAQKQTREAQEEWEHARIQAPFAGVCASLRARPGAVVQQGDVLLTLVDPAEMMVHIEAPADLLRRLEQGRSMQMGGRRGTIRAVASAVDPQHGTGLVQAALGPCSDCIVGDTVRVEVVLQQRDNVLTVPLSSIFLQDGRRYVYVIEGGKARRVPVALGLRTDRRAEILPCPAGGAKEKSDESVCLRVGDTVVSSNPRRLSDGAEVEVARTRRKPVEHER